MGREVGGDESAGLRWNSKEQIQPIKVRLLLPFQLVNEDFQIPGSPIIGSHMTVHGCDKVN